MIGPPGILTIQNRADVHRFDSVLVLRQGRQTLHGLWPALMARSRVSKLWMFCGEILLAHLHVIL